MNSFTDLLNMSRRPNIDLGFDPNQMGFGEEGQNEPQGPEEPDFTRRMMRMQGQPQGQDEYQNDPGGNLPFYNQAPQQAALQPVHTNRDLASAIAAASQGSGGFKWNPETQKNDFGEQPYKPDLGQQNAFTAAIQRAQAGDKTAGDWMGQLMRAGPEGEKFLQAGMGANAPDLGLPWQHQQEQSGDPFEQELMKGVQQGDKNSIAALQRLRTGQANNASREGVAKGRQDFNREKFQGQQDMAGQKLTLAQTIAENNKAFQQGRISIEQLNAANQQAANDERSTHNRATEGIGQQNADTNAQNAGNRDRLSSSMMALNDARVKQIDAQIAKGNADPMNRLELERVKEAFRTAAMLAKEGDTGAAQAQKDAEGLYAEVKGRLAAPQAQAAGPAQGPGERVRNSRTGQMGTRMPDGTVVPD